MNVDIMTITICGILLLLAAITPMCNGLFRRPRSLHMQAGPDVSANRTRDSSSGHIHSNDYSRHGLRTGTQSAVAARPGL